MSVSMSKKQHHAYFLFSFMTSVVAFTTTKISTGNNYCSSRLYISPSRSGGGGGRGRSNNNDHNNEKDDPERDNRNNLDHMSRYEKLINGDYDLSRFPNPLMDPMRDYRFGRDFSNDGYNNRHRRRPMNYHPMDHPMHERGPNRHHYPMDHPMDHPMPMDEGPETYINNDGYHNNDHFGDHPPMNRDTDHPVNNNIDLPNNEQEDRSGDDYIAELQRRIEEAEMKKDMQRRLYEESQTKRPNANNMRRKNIFRDRRNMNQMPGMNPRFDRSNWGKEERIDDNYDSNRPPYMGSEYIDNGNFRQRRPSMNAGRGGGMRDELMDELRYVRYLEAKINEHESRSQMNNYHHPRNNNQYNRRNTPPPPPPPFFGRDSDNNYGSSYGGNYYGR